MTTGFNGNVGCSGDGASTSTGIGGGMYAPSSSGTSFAQQPNVNVYMNMLEHDNQFHLLPESEGHLIEVSSDDQLDYIFGEDQLEDIYGEDHDEKLSHTPAGSKRKHHRHTPEQIQALESFFVECQHPNDKQRKELGSQLGMEPPKVKFWFQNKRNQMKVKMERDEKQQLKIENDRLKIRLEESMRNMTCRNCGRKNLLHELSTREQNLMNEIQRLRHEVNQLSVIASKFVGRPYLTFPNGVPFLVPRSGDVFNENHSEQPLIREAQEENNVFGEVGRSSDEAEKTSRIDLALKAMSEVEILATIDTPLWEPSVDGTTMMLNYHEYAPMTESGFGISRPGIKYEASKATAIFMMNHFSLVEMFMNVNQWSTIFSSIISRAKTVEVLSNGVADTFHGAVHIMAAEFHVPTPFVPTRSSTFARCSKKLSDGIWEIADVSIVNSHPSPLLMFYRRPSGCLIEAIADGLSKVTWVEHVEVDDRFVHQLYKPLVESCFAFGATHWLSTLRCQCERRGHVAAHIPLSELVNMGLSNQEAKRSLMRLGERLVRSYHQGVSSTTIDTWNGFVRSGASNVSIVRRKCIGEPGRPTGAVACASTSFWVPIPARTILNFLCNVRTRGKWDVFCNGCRTDEIVHLGTGQDPNDCVSLIRVTKSDMSPDNMMIIQETCTDALGSSVIFSSSDERIIGRVLAGEGSDDIPISPFGISVLPDGSNGMAVAGGSLLTVAFQVLADHDPNARISLGGAASIEGLITLTVERIKASVMEFGNNTIADVNNTYLVPNNTGQDGLIHI